MNSRSWIGDLVHTPGKTPHVLAVATAYHVEAEDTGTGQACLGTAALSELTGILRVGCIWEAQRWLIAEGWLTETVTPAVYALSNPYLSTGREREAAQPWGVWLGRAQGGVQTTW